MLTPFLFFLILLHVCVQCSTMPSPLSPVEIKEEAAHIRDDRGGDMVASCVTCITAAIIAVILRLLARRLSKAKILADDYMIIVALVALLLNSDI